MKKFKNSSNKNKEDLKLADFGEAGSIPYKNHRGEVLGSISDFIEIADNKDFKIKLLQDRVRDLESKLSVILNPEYHSHGNGD